MVLPRAKLFVFMCYLFLAYISIRYRIGYCIVINMVSYKFAFVNDFFPKNAPPGGYQFRYKFTPKTRLPSAGILILPFGARRMF